MTIRLRSENPIETGKVNYLSYLNGNINNNNFACNQNQSIFSSNAVGVSSVSSASDASSSNASGGGFSAVA